MSDFLFHNFELPSALSWVFILTHMYGYLPSITLVVAWWRYYMQVPYIRETRG